MQKKSIIKCQISDKIKYLEHRLKIKIRIHRIYNSFHFHQKTISARIYRICKMLKIWNGQLQLIFGNLLYIVEDTIYSVKMPYWKCTIITTKWYISEIQVKIHKICNKYY